MQRGKRRPGGREGGREDGREGGRVEKERRGVLSGQSVKQTHREIERDGAINWHARETYQSLGSEVLFPSGMCVSGRRGEVVSQLCGQDSKSSGMGKQEKEEQGRC